MDKYGYPKWALLDAVSGASTRAGESLFGDRKEKKCQGRLTKLNSAVLYNVCDTGHVLNLDSFRILDRETDWRKRGISEAIQVKHVKPSVNKCGGI